MTKDRVDISDDTAVSMPVRNMLAIIGAVAIGVWSYFGINERLNQNSTKITLMENDVEENLEQNMTNKVNIEFLQKQVEKILEDVENLKDANREIVYKNGS